MDVKFKVLPTQIGELLPAVGVIGVGFTTTTVVAGELEHPLFATTVYVPAANAVVLTIVGFCKVDENALGPVQEYVAPAIKLAVRFNAVPVHTGELLPAVGETGAVFTLTATIPAALVHPATVTVIEYVPVANAVAPGIVGFCNADEKLFGPVQLYVPPTTAEVVKFNVAPIQIGELLPAVGVAGIGFTITTVVATGLVHPATVTVTEYVPAIATVAPGRVGSSNADTNAPGPVHEYVPPTIVFDVKLIVVPAQTGELLPAVNATGVGFTITDVVPIALVQPATVIVNEYVPAANADALAIVGFCNADEKAFGPVHEYIAPATAVVVKFKEKLVQTGLLLLGEGVAGIGFTTTVVVATGLVQPPTVTVTEYVPAIAAVADAIVGSSNADEKALGPVQEYVAPITVFEVRFIVVPAQTGELLPAVGATGVGLTTTVVVATRLVHPTTVTVKLYVPAIAAVAATIVGSSNADEKALGPVHE